MKNKNVLQKNMKILMPTVYVKIAKYIFAKNVKLFIQNNLIIIIAIT